MERINTDVSIKLAQDETGVNTKVAELLSLFAQGIATRIVDWQGNMSISLEFVNENHIRLDIEKAQGD